MGVLDCDGSNYLALQVRDNCRPRHCHRPPADRAVVVRNALRRSEVPIFATLARSLVGMERGTSHDGARDILKLGDEVRLMPVAYAKPYVKRGKSRGRRPPFSRLIRRRLFGKLWSLFRLATSFSELGLYFLLVTPTGLEPVFSP